MDFSKVYSFFTDEVINDIYVSFIGFLIEITILSVIVPVFIWAFNRRRNNKQRFYGYLLYLKSLYNITVELGYFFEIDQEKTEKPFEGLSLFYRYWTKHSSEIKVSYYNHEYYYDLEPGLYCLIHKIGNKPSCEITQDSERLSKIINEINNVDSNIDRSILIYSKESELADSLLNLSILCKKILEYLNRYKNDKLIISDRNKSDLLTGLDMIVFSFLAEFYKRRKVVDKNFNWFMLKQQLSRYKRKTSPEKTVRETLLEEFLEINRKSYDKDFARGQFYLLIAVIASLFGARRNKA